MINVIDKNKNNPLFDLRISKYYDYGFSLILLDFD